MEAASLLERVSRAQEEAARGFEPDVAVLDGGTFPLLAPSRVAIAWDCFDRLLEETSAALREWCGEAPGPGAAFRVPEGLREGLLEAAVSGGAALDRIAAELGAEPAIFGLAVRYALAPFLGRYAERLAARIDLEGYVGQRCPVCGAEPRMAELAREDGFRRLACGLCGTRWRFQRLRCPFCGVEDQTKLGFLEAEELEGYRVDVCDACGRYIKTVDRRRLAEPESLELADALTPGLDEAAVARGYGLRAAPGRG